MSSAGRTRRSLTVGARVAIAWPAIAAGQTGVVAAMHRTREGAVASVRLDLLHAHIPAPTVEVSPEHLTVLHEVIARPSHGNGTHGPEAVLVRPNISSPTSRTSTHAAPQTIFRPVRRKRDRCNDDDEEDEELREIHRRRDRTFYSDMYKLSSSDTSDEQHERLGGASALLELQTFAQPPSHTPADIARLGVPGASATPALSPVNGCAIDEDGPNGCWWANSNGPHGAHSPPGVDEGH